MIEKFSGNEIEPQTNQIKKKARKIFTKYFEDGFL